MPCRAGEPDSTPVAYKPRSDTRGNVTIPGPENSPGRARSHLRVGTPGGDPGRFSPQFRFVQTTMTPQMLVSVRYWGGTVDPPG